MRLKLFFKQISQFMCKILALSSATGMISCGIAPSSIDSMATLSTPTKSLKKSYEYVRIPKYLAQTLNSSQFIPDHPKDENDLYGYLFDKTLLFHTTGDGKGTLNFRDEITILDEALIQQFGMRGSSQDDSLSIQTWESQEMGYHSDKQLTDFLHETHENNPNITFLQSIGKSVQNRDLWLLKISDQATTDENEPKILFVANMHGDEVVGRELMIQLIQHLMDQYGLNPKITEMIDNSQIYIMPSMNPDGFELHQRFNAAGVDLNRDFPDFTSDPSNTPEGRAPETQAIMELFKKHHFVVSANFHGGEVCFNLPWDTKPNQPNRNKFADDSLITAWGKAYASLNPTMIQRNGGSFDQGITYGYEWYEVNGGLQDWSIFYENSIHGTIELSYAKWPSARDLPRFWAENRDSLLGLLNRAREGIHMELVDDPENSQANDPKVPLDVKLTIMGNSRTLPYKGKILHRNTLPLNQEGAGLGKFSSPIPVRIEASGFSPIETTVPWAVFSGHFHKIVLKKPDPVAVF